LIPTDELFAAAPEFEDAQFLVVELRRRGDSKCVNSTIAMSWHLITSSTGITSPKSTFSNSSWGAVGGVGEHDKVDALGRCFDESRVGGVSSEQRDAGGQELPVPVAGECMDGEAVCRRNGGQCNSAAAHRVTDG
jgi:hypothetical protein